MLRDTGIPRDTWDTERHRDTEKHTEMPRDMQDSERHAGTWRDRRGQRETDEDTERQAGMLRDPWDTQRHVGTRDTQDIEKCGDTERHSGH